MNGKNKNAKATIINFEADLLTEIDAAAAIDKRSRTSFVEAACSEKIKRMKRVNSSLIKRAKSE